VECTSNFGVFERVTGFMSDSTAIHPCCLIAKFGGFLEQADGALPIILFGGDHRLTF
jgi:hypothetical protein